MLGCIATLMRYVHEELVGNLRLHVGLGELMLYFDVQVLPSAGLSFLMTAADNNCLSYALVMEPCALTIHFSVLAFGHDEFVMRTVAEVLLLSVLPLQRCLHNFTVQRSQAHCVADCHCSGRVM